MAINTWYSSHLAKKSFGNVKKSLLINPEVKPKTQKIGFQLTNLKGLGSSGTDLFPILLKTRGFFFFMLSYFPQMSTSISLGLDHETSLHSFTHLKKGRIRNNKSGVKCNTSPLEERFSV